MLLYLFVISYYNFVATRAVDKIPTIIQKPTTVVWYRLLTFQLCLTCVFTCTVLRRSLFDVGCRVHILQFRLASITLTVQPTVCRQRFGIQVSFSTKTFQNLWWCHTIIHTRGSAAYIYKIYSVHTYFKTNALPWACGRGYVLRSPKCPHNVKLHDVNCL